ncbi:Coenzyme F420 hydrogenase/dehydrogenase, beta subunit C-terminal domain [Empedobacter falsenii]
MIWNKDGFLVPILDNSFNENAIKLCPFNPNPDDDVKDEDILAHQIFPKAKQNDLKIGRFENTYVGYANQYRKTSSSGGIATYIFEQLLEKKIVDHLFIVKEINGTYQYQWFNSVNKIKQISKTRYIPVTLEKLFKEIDDKDGKVAVSGVACFVKAIRLKQHYNPQYKEKIPFIVGIICGGLKSKYYTDYLVQNSGVYEEYSNQEYRVKKADSVALDYKFSVLDKQKKLHSIDMKELGDMWGTGLFKANACDFCDDVLTELADISLGDAWISPYSQSGLGNSVIITRSKLADSLIINGIENGNLKVVTLDKNNVILSQSASFKHRQKAIKFRLNILKESSLKIKKRERLYQGIPLEFSIVQRIRLKLRKSSVEKWNGNLKEYIVLIDKEKKRLRIVTKWYHRIQYLKKRFGIKTI